MGYVWQFCHVLAASSITLETYRCLSFLLCFEFKRVQEGKDQLICRGSRMFLIAYQRKSVTALYLHELCFCYEDDLDLAEPGCLINVVLQERSQCLISCVLRSLWENQTWETHNSHVWCNVLSIVPFLSKLSILSATGGWGCSDPFSFSFHVCH